MGGFLKWDKQEREGGPRVWINKMVNIINIIFETVDKPSRGVGVYLLIQPEQNI